MKNSIFILLTLLQLSCNGQTSKENNTNKNSTVNNASSVQEYYIKNIDNSSASQSTGTVAEGKLINGKLMPFNGSNYFYFDTLSYLNGRAFLNSKTKLVALEAYKRLESEVPGRMFCIMECSNKEGGKLFPHRTHQNGLSIDFMMPLIKDQMPYYGLDTLGAAHYWLTFDGQGKYSEDPSIKIDFNIIAHHILLLDEIGRMNGLKVSKVIINTELKDELYASSFGKQLKAKGIYVVQGLTPLINSLHDDHYHIDFEEVK